MGTWRKAVRDVSAEKRGLEATTACRGTLSSAVCAGGRFMRLDIDSKRDEIQPPGLHCFFSLLFRVKHDEI
jgi:hypothetical protein